MATFSATYDANMIREDLADVITIMTPTDLPLTNLLDSQSVHDVYFDWGIDELSTPTSTASKKENESITYLSSADAPEPPRITAGVCIERNAVQIADTRRVVLEAGLDDAYNYMLWKQSVKTMKQLEFNMHWGNEAAKVASASAARMCIGVVTWCADTNFAETIDGIDYSAAAYQPYQSSFLDVGGALTRAELNDSILLPGYRNGMNIDGSVLLCGARVKRAISEFLMVYTTGGTARRNIGQASKAHVDTIDYFASDFGEIAMNLDRYFDAEAVTIPYNASSTINVDIDEVCVVLEPDHFHRMILRGLGHVPLAKDGDSTKGMCVAEIGIKCDNPMSITGAYNCV